MKVIVHPEEPEARRRKSYSNLLENGQQVIEPGAKFDAGKPRMDLIPPEVLAALGHIMRYGVDKYGARNWEKGMSWGRVFAACMRHLWAWWGGEEYDDESGMPHLWHALWCVSVLVAFFSRNLGTDDRKGA